MRKRKQRIEPPRCPYCGRRAVLRGASYVYGSHVYNPEQKFYVCAGYPACNSYVGVHLDSLRPKGSLANGRCATSAFSPTKPLTLSGGMAF